MLALGFDIGGTKCAVVLGNLNDDKYEIISKKTVLTADFNGYNSLLSRLFEIADNILSVNNIKQDSIGGIGISCGGPLDSEKGVILSPPNLPGWDNVPVTKLCEEHFGVKTVLCNDADACAVAEHRYGAGRGCRDMVFLTFGTGMGAGLILNGKLYSGKNNMAGEIGHIRLCDFGPSGYGKNGSFEGFCSGGGIARSASFYAEDFKKKGIKSAIYDSCGSISAKDIMTLCEQGDEFALFIMKNCAEKLGYGLSVLIDILNPEKIIIGSIYARNREFFVKETAPVLKREALARSLGVCEIVPSGLGENIGDIAALSIALPSKA